jgi:hypothetical protein
MLELTYATASERSAMRSLSSGHVVLTVMSVWSAHRRLGMMPYRMASLRCTSDSGLHLII